MDLELLKNLGATGESKLSKFTGNISAVYYHLASSPQYSLQPPCGKDNKIPEAILFDCHVVNVTKKLTAKTLPIPEKATVELGDYVGDTVTHFTGIVTVIIIGFNGCAEILIASQGKKRHPKGLMMVLNTKRLMILEKGAVASTGEAGKGAVHPTKALTRSA